MGKTKVFLGAVFMVILCIVTVGGSVPCSQSSQCQTDECCVTTNPPRGKRALAPTAGGVCQKLGSAKDSCYVMYTTVQDMNYRCPCGPGLVCVGSGMMEVPLGEVGTCS
ncbi:hypothetical protein EGW08_011680 [Elysia chlorotica]|uniref:Prokineticin domain-containing protein n=1 Tax=Elysia chlorotica TaxID=188477 RepID=A0A433TG51_ELYCH|nr:hypothetical protein EGW08_011680 [Elysia chlorotica]